MLLYENDEYRASKNWPYAISAGCVVYRLQGGVVEVLLLKREAGHSHNFKVDAASYNLPKGHLDLGDSLEATAKRETLEEAGCEVDLTTYLGSTTREFLHPRYKVQNTKTTHYFAGLWKNDIAQMDDEHDGKLWVEAEEAIGLLRGDSGIKGEDEIIKRLGVFLELARAS